MSYLPIMFLTSRPFNCNTNKNVPRPRYAWKVRNHLNRLAQGTLWFDASFSSQNESA